MMQWLVDPEHAPTGDDIVNGLSALAQFLLGETDSANAGGS